MVNTPLLKGKIVSEGYTQKEFSKKIGMSAQSLNYKINNNREFKVSEIEAICSILNITNKDEYFFTVKVDKTATN